MANIKQFQTTAAAGTISTNGAIFLNVYKCTGEIEISRDQGSTWQLVRQGSEYSGTTEHPLEPFDRLMWRGNSGSLVFNYGDALYNESNKKVSIDNASTEAIPVTEAFPTGFPAKPDVSVPAGTTATILAAGTGRRQAWIRASYSNTTTCRWRTAPDATHGEELAAGDGVLVDGNGLVAVYNPGPAAAVFTITANE